MEKSHLSLTAGIGGKSRLTFCRKWTLGNERLLPSEFPYLLCVVKSWVCTIDTWFLKFPNTTSPVKENAGVTKCQLKSPWETTPAMKSGWCLEEVEVNTVTIGNISIDNKAVETDGKRGRHREITVDFGARESVANPDEWPNVDLKPSKGSMKGQRYVDHGREGGQFGRTDL